MDEKPNTEQQEAPHIEPETEPRGNPEPDPEEVERGEEKLDQISGN